VGLLPVVIAVLLILSGLFRGVNVVRGTGGDRAAGIIFAVADVLFGVVALAWPDVTLLVLGGLFGARTLLFGLGRIWGALTSARGGVGKPAVPGRFHRWMRLAGAVVAVALAVGAAGLGAQLRDGAPTVSAFYTPPATVPETPGLLLKSEPFTTAVPAHARAWRILYTTTRLDGSAAVGSGIVLTSTKPASGPRPVIAWAHGTTGYTANCAPSNLPEPFTSGGLPALDRIVDNGWALVATDYAGLGTRGAQPYLIGQGEGRSVLDAVRAARHLDTEQPALSLGDDVVIWGHSQGGQAALWTGGLAPSYAPELRIAGVAAMAPASDAIGLVRNLPNVTGGSVFASYVAAAYTDSYPDVKFNDYITGAAQTFVREMAGRCLSEPGVLVSIVSAIAIDKDRTIFATDPTTGPMGQRLRENTPTLPIPAPVFIAQGLADPLVVPAVQGGYVKARCLAGQALEYRVYEGKDHMGLVADDSPLITDLVAWTQARFDGGPAPDNCSSLPALTQK